MDFENKVLRNNMGMCIFPVGDCKSLCGAPTLLDGNGSYTPFCAKHTREVEARFRQKQQGRSKKKKKHIRGRAKVFV